MISIRRFSIAMVCVTLGVPAIALSQAAAPADSKPLSTSLGMVVFPAKGQTPQKQAQDEGECYAWSKGQTGVDPMAPPPAAGPPATQSAAEPAPAADGSRLRGAARGAAAGAVIGEVANNDASQGAAVGATVGVVAGGRQSRKSQQQAAQQATQQQQQATQQQAAQQQATQQQQMDLFKKGFAACLEPKGYTVK
jgi:pyruvate/2-oxoglutarate dehydrogenase complex dihydrolipoamide acyltransferase (E2) component